MDIRKIENGLSVGAQINPQDVQELARLGFKSIICNRPDSEGPGQASFQEIEKAALSAGINAHHIPIVPGGIKSHDIRAFALAMNEMPSPVFAYCRTGTRSATLWSLSAASSGNEIAEILQKTANAGYDLSALLPMLQEFSANAASPS
jgi:sulfide:quinone oxidoreductase